MDYSGDFTLTTGATLASHMWLFVGAKVTRFTTVLQMPRPHSGRPHGGRRRTSALPQAARSVLPRIECGPGETREFQPVTASPARMPASSHCLESAGSTIGAITPAPLAITADNGTKAYGDVFGLVGTAFSSSGLKNGETIGSVSLTSLGAPATAGVAGSPHAITPSAATGAASTSPTTPPPMSPVPLRRPGAADGDGRRRHQGLWRCVRPCGHRVHLQRPQERRDHRLGSLTSLGAPATAGVAASPDAITPSAATGGASTSPTTRRAMSSAP